MKPPKIDSWHENGTSIWFYYKDKRFKETVKVPKYICESIALSAVSEFKRQFQELMQP